MPLWRGLKYAQSEQMMSHYYWHHNQIVEKLFAIWKCIELVIMIKNILWNRRQNKNKKKQWTIHLQLFEIQLIRICCQSTLQWSSPYLNNENQNFSILSVLHWMEVRKMTSQPQKCVNQTIYSTFHILLCTR